VEIVVVIGASSRGVTVGQNKNPCGAGVRE
jgi:hypothetical protein